MYESYWKLNFRPFEEGQSAQSYAPTRPHEAALLKLRYLIDQRKGIGVLVGEHGLGKTYLTQVLETELLHSQPSAFVRLHFPCLSSQDTLAYLAHRLAVPIQDGDSESRLLCKLEDHLAQRKDANQPVVFVVDDAHALEHHQLQTLKMLLSLRENGSADLSIILSGRGDLLARLQRLPSLDQRIVVRAALSPLEPDDVAKYLAARLRGAGRTDAVFDDRAGHTIWELSQGIPRRINQLCDLALLVGYVDELRWIGPAEIEAAAEELVSIAA